MGGGLRKSDVGSQMSDKRRLTVNSKQSTVDGKRLTANGKRLTVLVISLVLLISFVTVAIATGFFGTNTTKISSLEKGLVAHYPLDGINHVKDVTPYGNHGTNYGATLTTGVKDEPNGAYSFDGNDYVDMSTSIISAKGAFTVSLWVNSFNTKYHALISQYPGLSDTKRLFLGIYNNDKACLQIGSTRLDSITILEHNKWYHLVYMRDSNNNVSIIINGILDTTSIITTDISNYNMRIGGTTESTHFANSSMQDVRIYNRALSEDEIKLLFDSYKPKASASDLNKGLVGHWMLDSENGAKDLTPYGNHGTGQGGVTIGGAEDRKGKNDGATNFDGVDDYVGLSSSENNHLDLRKDLTMSAWVYANSFDTFNYVISKGNTGGFADQQYSIATSGANPVICIGGTQMDTSTPLSKNKWYLLTATLDSGILKYYLNSKYIKQLDVSGTTITYKPNMNIGVRSSTGSSRAYFWNGLISDVRIYNRALSADEIQLLFDSYKPKEASVGNLNKGLVLDMPLTTKWMKSSTIVSDRTPYGNDGVLMNGVNITNEGAVFDGVNDYVEIQLQESLNLDSFSLSVWCYLENMNGGYILNLNENGEMNSKPIVYHSTSQGKFGYWEGSNNYYGSIAETNKWYHIIIVRNRTGFKTYINGDLSGTFVSALPNINLSSVYLSRKTWLKGKISNVKIWDRALSEEEIKLLYESSGSLV